MPDRDVKTIRDLIYYQYAKIIAKSVFGKSSKKTDYGFIKATFRDLKSGAKKWSEITREDKEFVQTEKACIYCGSTNDLQWEHIVPRSIRIKDNCETCERILGIHNQIWACKQCNLKKKTQGLYSFFKELFPNDRKYYDRIPSLLEKKYLKTIFYCHECSNTLDHCDINLDGVISVLDIDFIIKPAAFA